MKKLFCFIVIMFSLAITVKGQTININGFVYTSHSVVRKEVISGSMTWPYSITSGGPEGQYIGRRIETEDGQTVEYLGACAFAIIDIPSTVGYTPPGGSFQQVNYRVVHATVTARVQNSGGNTYNGYYYAAGILNPGSLIIKSSASQYSQSEKQSNLSAIHGG